MVMFHYVSIHSSSSNGRLNMRILLVVLIVLTVSGDEKTIKGILRDSVLLPCTCSERDIDKEFKWQKEKPNKMLVFKHNESISNFDGKYKDRTKIFLSENSSNCSVLIMNVTADDEGLYRCSFHSQKLYMKFFVNLIVSANYSVCLKSSTNTSGNVGKKVFQCDVQGHYREAEIQWKLDGQVLANSSMTYITPTHLCVAPTELYHFKSELITELNRKPTCHVKANGMSSVTIYGCSTEPEHRKTQGRPQPEYFIPILVVLVLGISFFLWRRWKFSPHLPRIREVETDNFLS